MNSKDGYMTMAEHHAQLKADGKWDEYISLKMEKESAHQRRLEERARAEKPLVEALNSVGVNVPSMFYLTDDKKLDPAAIPILFEHLHYDYPDQIREGILRALGRPQLLPYWDKLVDLFENNSANLSPKIRYVAAAALFEASNDTVIDDVIRLAKKQSLGIDRAPLLLRLHWSKSPKAKMALMELRDDPTLGKEIKRMRRLARQGPVTKL